MVITIWGNAEFGCELAYRIAKDTDKKVIIIDMDLLSAKADLYLKVKKEPDNINEKRPGLDILIEWVNRSLNSEIITKAAVQREEIKNLYIITGSYDIENFEYYNEESIEEIIKKAKQYFDVTILLVNKFIYDAYTIAGLCISDINIVATEANTINFREFNNYIAFLNEKQGLGLEKTKYVAYEYIPGLHIAETEINEITDYNYLGSIRYSKNRVDCRSKNKCYAKEMEKSVQIEYLKIIEKLELTPKLKINEKVKNWFKMLKDQKGVFVNANSKDA